MAEVYLASSFDLVPRVRHVHRHLTHAGHAVPDKWWDTDLKDELDTIGDNVFYAHTQVRYMADRHWGRIPQVDAFVLVCPEPGDDPKAFNGGNVELGYAHAHGVPLYSVGELDRSAMYEPITRCRTIEDLLDALKVVDHGLG